MENETRNKPEWFDVGPVMKKEVGNLSFEVWANGRFNIGAPNGDWFKSDISSAEEWLVEHGINNDEQLSNAMNENDGWSLVDNRWFDLIAFELDKEHDPVHAREVWCDGEVAFEYDKESFEEWIDDAIENWED